MQIGIDFTPAVEEGAGIGRFTRELIAALLADHDEEHYVLIVPKGAEPPEWVSAAPHVRWSPLPFSARFTSIFWHRLHVPAPVEWFVGDLDVFHATNYMLPPLKHARSVVTVHDLSFLRHPEMADPRLVRYLTSSVPETTRKSDVLTADSAFTKEEMVDLLGVPPEKIMVVYGGVSARFQPVVDADALAEVRARYGLPERFLLCVTRIEARKNIPRLLEAYRILVDRTKIDVPLFLAGGRGWGYDEAMLRREALGLTNTVHLMGHVPDDDLPALISAATVFVYPSLYEGFGLPPLEAMACGTPVVASSAPCLTEILGDAALLAPPEDSEALAEALAQAVADADLRAGLRKRGLRRAQQFSWQAAAKQLVSAYHLAAGSSSPALSH